MAPWRQRLSHGFRISCVRRDRPSQVTGLWFYVMEQCLVRCTSRSNGLPLARASLVVEVIMCRASKNKRGSSEMLQDTLIRLAMDSDRVTEQTNSTGRLCFEPARIAVRYNSPPGRPMRPRRSLNRASDRSGSKTGCSRIEALKRAS